MTPQAPTVVLKDLDDVEIKPVKWLIPGRIPVGSMTMIFSDPGDGKSTFTRHLASSISVGKCAMGMTYPNPAKGRILFASGEDSIGDVVKTQIIAEGGDPKQIVMPEIHDVDGRGNLSKSKFRARNIEILKQKLVESPDVRMVVIDTISSFLGESGVNDSRIGELRAALDPLVEMAEATGVALIIVHHTNKTETGKAAHKVSGSQGYAAACRLVYWITKDDCHESLRLVVPVKLNLRAVNRKAAVFRAVELGDSEATALRYQPSFSKFDDGDFAEIRRQLVRVEFDADRDVNANELASRKPESGQSDPNKVKRCAFWLAEFLKEYAYPSDEIDNAAFSLGFTKDNINKAKKALKDSSGLQNSNQGGFGGVWWSGIGLPQKWVRRPEPHETHETHETH